MDFDIAGTIGAVNRELIDCEHEGAPARMLVAERTYPAPPEDVWDALTSAERIPRWFLPITGDLTLGGRYQLEGNAGGEILACDPPKHLGVTWEFGGGITWVDVHLSPTDGGETQLRLEHTAHIDPDDPHMQQFGPGAVGVGWDLTLLGLQQHLAAPDRSIADEAAGLLTTPGGRELVERSGQAWVEADIAAGTPEADARRRGEATIAAYSGGGEDHHGAGEATEG